MAPALRAAQGNAHSSLPTPSSTRPGTMTIGAHHEARCRGISSVSRCTAHRGNAGAGPEETPRGRSGPRRGHGAALPAQGCAPHLSSPVIPEEQRPGTPGAGRPGSRGPRGARGAAGGREEGRGRGRGHRAPLLRRLALAPSRSHYTPVGQVIPGAQLYKPRPAGLPPPGPPSGSPRGGCCRTELQSVSRCARPASAEGAATGPGATAACSEF